MVRFCPGYFGKVWPGMVVQVSFQSGRALNFWVRFWSSWGYLTDASCVGPVKNVFVPFTMCWSGLVRFMNFSTVQYGWSCPSWIQSISQCVSLQEVNQCLGDFRVLDKDRSSSIKKPSLSMYCCFSSLPRSLPWWSATACHTLLRTKKPHCRKNTENSYVQQSSRKWR